MGRIAEVDEYLRNAQVYSPECVELDFSHLAAWQTASLEGSMLLLRLFAARCAQATRKKSPYLLGAPTAHEERGVRVPEGGVD